jgi:hypothetical protein
MALDAERMGLLMAKVVIDNSTSPPTPDMTIKLQQYWKDMAKAIVDEITKNGEVNTGITVNIPSTSSPGSPSSGATTSKGTIS